MKAFLGLGVRNFESAIAERDSVIGDLQAQLRALQDADQRDFLNDNSDQLGVVIHAKNEVIQELRVELLAEEAAARNVNVSSYSLRTCRAEVHAEQTSERNSDVASMTPALVREVQSLQCSLEDKEACLEALERQVQLHKAESERGNSQAAAKVELCMEVQSLQTTLAERDARLQTQEQQAASQSQEVARLQARLAAQEQTLKHRAVQLAEREDAIDQASKAVGEREAETVFQRHALATRKSELLQLERKLSRGPEDLGRTRSFSSFSDRDGGLQDAVEESKRSAEAMRAERDRALEEAASLAK